MSIARTWMTCLLLAGCAQSSAPEAQPEPEPAPEPEGPQRFFDAVELVADTRACAEGPTEEVAIDERTSSGFSAADILTFAGGKHQEPITWQLFPGPDNAEDVVVGPETGTHELAILVEPRSTTARFHVPERDVIGHGLVCKPWLEIDVHVILHSAGGALLEGFDATLVAEKSRFAYIAAVSEGAAPVAQGSLTATRPTAELERTQLRIVFTPYGVTGTVTAFWSDSGFDDELAHFGKARCGQNGFALGLDDRIGDDTSPRELARELGAFDDLSGAWDDGSAVNASISFALNEESVACGLEVDWGTDQFGFELSISGDVTIATADGWLQETMPGGLSLPIDDPTRAGEHRISGGQTWTPASSTPAGLTSVADLDRFESVSLTAGASRDSTGVSGHLSLRGEQPETCAEALADGTCPDFESFGYAELGR